MMKPRKPAQGQSFAEIHPELIAQWSDNNPVSPMEVGKSSSYKALWECDVCGHQWKATVNHRHMGRGCPCCSGTVVVPGINDIATTHPEIIPLWDDEDFSPQELSYGTKSKVTITLICGHSFFCTPSRVPRQCPQCIPEGNSLKDVAPHLVAEWSDKNDFSPEDVTYNSAKTVWWECSKKHIWSTPAYQRVNSHSQCPQCSARNFSSSGEGELGEFLSTILDCPIEKNCRSIISPYELDFYIPSLNVAIEFNGLWWHSDAVQVDKNYHYNKFTMCRNKGVQLITVWEDDWENRRDIVKRMLAHKFGISDESKVFARNLCIGLVDSHKARDFCDKNHIQGFTSGSLYVGLMDSDGMVACGIFRRNGDSIYLDRYCTSKIVVGGMGKILSYVSQQEGFSQIVTFSDNSVSDGGLYIKLGFVKDKELPPDYHYLYKKRRVHKSNFRKKRFLDDEFIFVDGLSEAELSRLNNIPRIWDSGKVRWVYPL